MKTLFHFLRKNIFLYLSILSLLTACETADNVPPNESTAALTADNSISQEPSAPGSHISDDPSKPDISGPHNASAPETAASDAATPEAMSQASSSADISSASALSELQVHFIDVGQGDATLIICGNESMLIDAGDNNKGTTVQRYLQKQSIEDLTYIIGTHPDSDHIGGLDVIITKFDCDTIIMPDVPSDTTAYCDVIDAMEYRNYKNTLPRVGDIYSLGDAEFTIIAPNGEYADDNNSSVGIRLVHGNNSFLFIGDAEAESEANILQNNIDVDADVLHAGHHGSSTSANRDFISRVSPSYAVISCGRDNPYGHPHKQTLNLLKELDVQVFRTDEQGSIVAVSDGESIVWNMEPSQTWNTGTPAKSGAAAPTDTATPAPFPEPEATVPESNTITYVLNHNTNKFHEPDCSSVETIREYNREDTTLSREEIIAAGFVPCKKCNP